MVLGMMVLGACSATSPGDAPINGGPDNDWRVVGLGQACGGMAGIMCEGEQTGADLEIVALNDYRTQVPVEYDDLRNSINRLLTDLGPTPNNPRVRSATSSSRRPTVSPARGSSSTAH